MPSASKPRCSRRRSLHSAIPAFPLSNETKVEEYQEEDGMDNGSHAADARRLDKTRAEDRHRNPVEVQIEKDSGVHKEGARKELAHVLPRNPSNHGRLLVMF
jgi:D-serine deaminase-like pyridoxal phosphate-dependent protein